MEKEENTMKKAKQMLTLCLVLILALWLLAGCGRKAAIYEVLATDEAGKPVPGVTLQFCSDTECILGKTDDKGVAAFEKEAGHYPNHVLKVPEGFAADSTEYSAPAEPGRMTIVLK